MMMNLRKQREYFKINHYKTFRSALFIDEVFDAMSSY